LGILLPIVKEKKGLCETINYTGNRIYKAIHKKSQRTWWHHSNETP